MKKSLILSILLSVFALTAFGDEPPAQVPPAAAPAAATPAPAPAPSGDQGGSPEGGSPSVASRTAKPWEDDLDEKLDGKKLDGAAGGTPPPKPGEKPATKPDAGKPAAKLAEAPKPEADDVPQFKTNKELRDFATSQRKEVKRLDAELKTTLAKMEEVSKKVPQNQAQQSAQTEAMAALQKKLESYEEKIRFLDYQKSSEYEEKYLSPYKTAYTRAIHDIKELEVAVATGRQDEDGKPEMGSRAATDADFVEIYNLPLGKASKLAAQKFQESAPIVMAHYNEVRKLSEAAFSAVEEYKVKGGEIEKQKKLREGETRNTAEKLWKELNSQMGSNEAHKSNWGKEDDKPELNAELDKGFAFADQLFSDETDSWPLEDKIKLHVGARHRIAGFYKLRHVVKSKDEEIARLTKTLEEMKGSGPGRQRDGKGSGAGDTGSTARGWEAALDEKLGG